MTTIQEIVTRIIQNSPFIEEFLVQDLINYSALARRIRPEIESVLLKDAKEGAIIMALKRYKQNIANDSHPDLISVLKSIKDISIRSGITEFSFLNSPTINQKQILLMNTVTRTPKDFLTITDGIYETSFFVSSNFESVINLIFEDEIINFQLSDLCSITIILPPETIQTPGVYYAILKNLALKNISFTEVLSSSSELTIFLPEKDLNTAFHTIKNLGHQII